MKKHKKCSACIIGDMKLQKKMDTKRQYKARRFVCDNCGVSDTEFGDGSGDEINIYYAIQDSNELMRSGI